MDFNKIIVQIFTIHISAGPFYSLIQAKEESEKSIKKKEKTLYLKILTKNERSANILIGLIISQQPV